MKMEVDEKFGYTTWEEMCIDWEDSGLSRREFCKQICYTADACEDLLDESECEDTINECVEDCEIRLEYCFYK